MCAFLRVIGGRCGAAGAGAGAGAGMGAGAGAGTGCGCGCGCATVDVAAAAGAGGGGIRMAGTIFGFAGTGAFWGSLAGCIVIFGTGAAALLVVVAAAAFFGGPSVVIPSPTTPSVFFDLFRSRGTLSDRLLPASLLALLLPPGLSRGDVDVARDPSAVATESLPCDDDVLNALELVPFFGDPEGVTAILGVVCADTDDDRLDAGTDRVRGVGL
jgi:hypothetical protein